MAKIKRSVLKAIIKECLVEILIEGIDSDSMEDQLIESVSKPRRQKALDPMIAIQKRRDALDSKKVDTRKPIMSESTINSITQDPTMQDIFADTAATTLASQGLSNSSSPRHHVPADKAAKMVNENKLSDLFDGANNWAALAFTDSPKK